MLVQQNEFEYEFEFYKRSSNFRKKNEFNIPTPTIDVVVSQVSCVTVVGRLAVPGQQLFVKPDISSNILMSTV